VQQRAAPDVAAEIRSARRVRLAPDGARCPPDVEESVAASLAHDRERVAAWSAHEESARWAQVCARWIPPAGSRGRRGDPLARPAVLHGGRSPLPAGPRNAAGREVADVRAAVWRLGAARSTAGPHRAGPAEGCSFGCGARRGRKRSVHRRSPWSGDGGRSAARHGETADPDHLGNRGRHGGVRRAPGLPSDQCISGSSSRVDDGRDTLVTPPACLLRPRYYGWQQLLTTTPGDPKVADAEMRAVALLRTGDRGRSEVTQHPRISNGASL
jgi:hypothetical protein